ncbi:MAG TPA: hypothetical protein VJ717_13120 [Gemmatimonadaceae bacterium]|nr:hypothetical protein [Gemmatimonadaceae bacterium]
MTERESFAATERAPNQHEQMLVEFATSLQKHTFYPKGHPMVNASAERLHARLTETLAERGSLSIGVARRQLVIDGESTDSAHPILRDLASLLHRQQIGALVLSAGIALEELSDVLSTLGSDNASQADAGEHVALLSLEGRWPHAQFMRMSYDRLQLGSDDDTADDAPNDRVTQLWLGLARAALTGGNEDSGRIVGNAEQMAGAINAKRGDDNYEHVIAGYFQQLAAELDHAGPRRHMQVRAQLSDLLGTLQGETLERLLHMGGDQRKRMEFMRHATSILAAPAVVDLLRCASTAAGRGISDSMVRLLAKLGRYAQQESGAGFDQELRDHVRDIVTKWTLNSPNPEEYDAALTALARTGDAGAEDDRGRSRLEPERLIAIALHVGEGGPSLTRAARALAARSDWTEILADVEAAEPSRARDLLLQELVTPRQLSRVLPRLPKSRDIAERLVMRLGPSAVQPLIEALGEPSLKDHEDCVALLEQLGVAAVPGIASRIMEERPQVQALLLSVLAAVGVVPANVDVFALARHAMGDIRREAIRLLLTADEHREKAVALAMQDSDPRILRDGLRAAPRPLAPALAHLVMQRVDRQSHGMALEERVMAIHVLATCRVPAVRDWLARGLVRKRFFGGRKLVDKSPDMLSALRALATTWRDDRTVADILALANKHRDGEVRAAVHFA